MKDILERLVRGELDIEEAEKILKSDAILEFDDVAKFDIKRNDRTGFPEAIFAQSKDYDDLILIIEKYLEANDEDLIITKLSLPQEHLTSILPRRLRSLLRKVAVKLSHPMILVLQESIDYFLK